MCQDRVKEKEGGTRPGLSPRNFFLILGGRGPRGGYTDDRGRAEEVGPGGRWKGDWHVVETLHYLE